MTRGVTLLEVLFAIILFSIGILGSLALFSVCGSFIRKAKIVDASATAGEAAIASFAVERMNDPERWIYWDAATSTTALVQPHANPPPYFNYGDAGKPFHGHAFCIDPRGFEHNRLEDPAGVNSQRWAWFPGTPEAIGNNTVANASRMPRLTLCNGGPIISALERMTTFQAEKVFGIEDELMYERPKDNSLPAVQLYNQMATPNGNVPSRRQEEGRLSWMAILVPKIFANGVSYVDSNDVVHGTTRDDEEYVLSIVIFYNRSGETMHVPGSGPDIHPWNEWTAKIMSTDWHSAGLGGGEVTITTNDPVQDNAQTFNDPKYLDLHSGSWVLLGQTVPHFITTIQNFQWYRVADTDDVRQVSINGQVRYQRDVTLIGPDWNNDVWPRVITKTDPITGIVTEIRRGDGVAEEADVIILPNVVHVYERTIRLHF